MGYSLPSCIVIELKVSGLSLTIAMERKKHCIKLCKAFDEIRFPSVSFGTQCGRRFGFGKVLFLPGNIFGPSLSKICLILGNYFFFHMEILKKRKIENLALFLIQICSLLL